MGDILRYLLTFLLTCSFSSVAQANEGETSGRLYTTKEEQYDTGRKHKVTDWFTWYGLIELEWENNHIHFIDHDHSQQAGTGANLQIGTILKPSESIFFETVSEFDSSDQRWSTGEAYMEIDLDPWQINIGRQQLPFGKFISHLATGPILEFAELNEKSLTLNYQQEDFFEVSASIYDNSANLSTDNRKAWAWSIESPEEKPVSVGLSLVSDLSAADTFKELYGNAIYDKNVRALGAYLFWKADNFNISLEAIGTLETINTIENDVDRPLTWNVEFNQLFAGHTDYSLRLEGSDQLKNSPYRRAVIGFSHRLDPDTAISLELMRERYRHTDSYAHDDNYESINRVYFQLSAAF